MAVIGAATGLLIGAAMALAILWMVKAPFRAARYVRREVRARDVRNRETLTLDPQERERLLASPPRPQPAWRKELDAMLAELDENEEPPSAAH